VKIGILGLQGDVAEHARALDEAGAMPVVVKRAAELAEVDALVLPGGESTTISKLLHRFELLEPLIQRARAGMPLYGTCAGAILMAREIVGDQPIDHQIGVMDISVRRNAYGRQIDSFESDLDVSGLREPFRAVFIRAPVIESIGEGVEVLAEHDGHPVLVRQGHLFASTFHPEMTPDARVHGMFVTSIEGR
jgi:5'-phosphate synthase pdxT subunit